MTIALPPPLAAYFTADRAGDVEAFLDLFTEHAVVVDERRTYTGRDEIRAWKAGAAAQYSYTAEPFAIAAQDGQTIVTAHLSGNFPGSPVDLRYGFTLQDSRIERLEIAP